LSNITELLLAEIEEIFNSKITDQGLIISLSIMIKMEISKQNEE